MIFFEKFGRVVVRLLTVLLFFSLLCFSYFYFSIYILQKDYVNFFGYTFFEVGSGSMSPTILSNDVVIVKVNDKFKTNDVITFFYNDNIVTHRVIKISGDILITKGDANNINDFTISKRDVIGKVVYVCKGLGIWQRVFTSPGIVASVVITLLLLIITFSYDSSLYKKFRMRRLSKKKIREMKKVIREKKKKEKDKVKNKTTKKKKVTKEKRGIKRDK